MRRCTKDEGVVLIASCWTLPDEKNSLSKSSNAKCCTDGAGRVAGAKGPAGVAAELLLLTRKIEVRVWTTTGGGVGAVELVATGCSLVVSPVKVLFAPLMVTIRCFDGGDVLWLFWTLEVLPLD